MNNKIASPSYFLFEQLKTERINFYSAIKEGKDFTQLRPIRKRISELEKELKSKQSNQILELLGSDIWKMDKPV